MSDTVLENARLVLGSEIVRGHVVFRGGRIHAIGHGSTAQPGAMDCEGDFLLPGFVELHTDNLEKHLLPRPGARWPAAAAVVAHDAQLLASGITTALDALTVGEDEEESPLDPHDTVRSLGAARIAGRLRVDHYLHLRCELPCADLPARLAPLCDDPRLRLVSLMDHTPGQRQFRDLQAYRAICGRNGARWCDEAFAARVLRFQCLQATFASKHRALVMALAAARGAHLASHDDADAEHVALAVASGARIAEFPVTMAAARAARDAGMCVLAGAPNVVRGGSHSGNVAAVSLAHAGLLEVLSSDYVPASLLQAVFLLAELEGWSLPRAVATATRTPARAVGFGDRGALAAGFRADVLQVRERGLLPTLERVWIQGEQRY